MHTALIEEDEEKVKKKEVQTGAVCLTPAALNEVTVHEKRLLFFNICDATHNQQREKFDLRTCIQRHSIHAQASRSAISLCAFAALS